MNLCKICHSVKTKLKFVYKSKPKGETDFNIEKKKYYREFFECCECGHMFSDPEFEITNFYEGSYTNKLLTDKSLSKAKVLEEIDELIEAIEENTNKIHEAADVFYHLLMYLEANDVKIEEVMEELEKRKK